MDLRALFELFKGVEHKGPGVDSFTRSLASLCSEFHPNIKHIADYGCGAGASAIQLATVFNGSDVTVDAIDICSDYVEETKENAAALGLSEKVNAFVGDILTPPHEPESLDLLWAEGCIFVPGFEKGLTLWRDYVNEGGLVVVSDTCWTVSNPENEIKRYWDTVSPGVVLPETKAAIARKAGYQVIGVFELPRSGFDDFYVNLSKRLKEVEADPELKKFPGMDEQIRENEHEIEMYESYGSNFNYFFFILKKC
eukprot:TRINITY_DN143_c1_g3_i1.p1 TRINITY_DN143_c1_g3~~TRINITY_DN143_c1_g3_i1.p1  ORF type:complete len:296 (-),score=60.80 TRINITY_DN143_c1_g3_i1:114-872(-)